MLACLVIDGLDQTIFQTFTSLDLSGYQSYDKALDVYYLSIAYIGDAAELDQPRSRST